MSRSSGRAGISRGQALLVGLVVLGLGGAGYALFQRQGLEGFSAGIAASSVLMLLVLGWTASYLLRVVSGRMTYMDQRRTYRAAYDAYTDDQLQARFEALSPEEQQQLLTEVGYTESGVDPG
ncbi:MAG: DUF3007 family protein [Cyanobacteriota bacterium]|nr:DUF3007 family protein [Cyanobacteriota bacterium]